MAYEKRIKLTFASILFIEIRLALISAMLSRISLGPLIT